MIREGLSPWRHAHSLSAQLTESRTAGLIDYPNHMVLEVNRVVYGANPGELSFLHMLLAF